MDRDNRLALAGLLTVTVATMGITAAPQAPTPAVAGGKPAFDVVSIKRNPEPGGNNPLAPPVGGRLALRKQSVRGLISSSYGVQDYQIIGGPGWLRSDGFDVDALTEATPLPAPPQFLLMIRTMLADRFQLVMHGEQRNIPIYKLVMARANGQLGPNIRRGECVQPPRGGGAPTADPQSFCGTHVAPGTMFVRGGTMRTLAQQVGRYTGTGRPVFDATNLTGQFEWELKWTPEPLDGNAPADAISIFTALQDQLGVKLEPGPSSRTSDSPLNAAA